MPRKALVPARAALRFAPEAAVECGGTRPCRRGAGRAQGASPQRGRVLSAVRRSGSRPPATNAYENLGRPTGHRGFPWALLATCVEARSLRATTNRLSERASSLGNAWSRYAPIPPGAERGAVDAQGSGAVERQIERRPERRSKRAYTASAPRWAADRARAEIGAKDHSPRRGAQQRGGGAFLPATHCRRSVCRTRRIPSTRHTHQPVARLR